MSEELHRYPVPVREKHDCDQHRRNQENVMFIIFYGIEHFVTGVGHEEFCYYHTVGTRYKDYTPKENKAVAH